MRTYRYIILISSFIFCFGSYALGQEKEVVKDTAQHVHFFQEIMVELDIAPFVETALINKDIHAYQGHLQLNLKNKFYPAFEAGYATASKTIPDGVAFDTKGYFGKIGIDFPIIKPVSNDKRKKNMALGGLRLGMSQSSYSLMNQILVDPYWGGSDVINENSLKATKFWAEGTVGVKASIYKGIYIGWNIRYKLLINKVKDGAYEPWFIPGYGFSGDSTWGFSYVIGYRF